MINTETMIKSTYNFVPAPNEDQVYEATWAHQVSHDIPFSDGESGEIELKITAQTPVFIRNGHSKNSATDEFSNYIDNEGNKQYFIPGSSLKGMIRSVLEIMSFSRMNPKLVNVSSTFGLRDMNNKQYSQIEIRGVKAGWLIKKNDNWIVQPCESDRVRLESIPPHFNNITINIKDSTAKEKYKAFNIVDFTKQYSFNDLTEIDKTGNVYSLTDKNAEVKGHLVMFGSINNKKYDYIFHSPNEEINYELNDADLVDKILAIEKDNENSLWNYFLNELKLTKIPIFFKENKGKVIHFGFSKLYRLNNGHSLNELEPLKSYTNNKKDLATTIFGYTEKEESLKGRVVFSHAKLINPAKEGNVEERILSTPNPSYYPYYLEQNNPNNKYNTYIDEATLRGFKRYPFHNDIKSSTLQKDSMSSVFRPLNEGTVFSFKIRFHNLRKIEIGALISAINHHNTPNSFHNLGGGKSYGFGKVKVEIEKDVTHWNRYLYFFENEMEDHLKKINSPYTWANSPMIREILALSQNATSDVNKSLVYPQLEVANVKASDANEFNNVKKGKGYLKSFSSLNGEIKLNSAIKLLDEQKNKEDAIALQKIITIKKDAHSLFEVNEFDKAIDKYNEVMAIIDDGSFHEFKRQVEIKKHQQQEMVHYNAVIESNSIAGYEEFLSKYPLSNHKIEIENKLRKLKAASGIPENIINKDNFKQFANNTDNWVKKLPDKTILGSGFEAEHLALLIKIGNQELQNKRLAKEWQEGGANEKKISQWYDAKIARDCIKKIR